MKEALLKSYTPICTDFYRQTKIVDNLLLSEDEDESRLRKVIDGLIEDGTLRK